MRRHRGTNTDREAEIESGTGLRYERGHFSQNMDNERENDVVAYKVFIDRGGKQAEVVLPKREKTSYKGGLG